MKECYCKSHHRFLPNNIREKMQNAIIRHIVKHYKDVPVHIMSLGAAGCLQDLMIILKLAEAGLKSIHITMVEPFPCRNAYPDFKFFINKIKTIFRMEDITSESYTDISQLDINEHFDIIYAIDYDECNSKEYLLEHKHLNLHNDEIKTSDPDKPTLDLIKVARYLTSHEHGLIIASRKKHIVHMTPQNLPFYGTP